MRVSIPAPENEIPSKPERGEEGIGNQQRKRPQRRVERSRPSPQLRVSGLWVEASGSRMSTITREPAALRNSSA